MASNIIREILLPSTYPKTTLRMAGHPGAYMGWWGFIGSPKQKNVTTYTISPYVGSPLKGSSERAIFNVWRRTKAQALYVIIPGIIVWNVWAQARDYNEYLYTKAGREELERVNV